jgi:glycerol-3-phosphate dehydrogenase
VLYYDAQADDARHTLAVARTAAHYGALVRNSTEVTGPLRTGGRVVGATVRDVESGQVAEVRARVVISATGVWSDDVQRLTGSRGRFNVRASKGIHLVVPRDRIASETGIILRYKNRAWGRIHLRDGPVGIGSLYIPGLWRARRKGHRYDPYQ